MAQSNYNVPDEDGANHLATLNAITAAIATNNSGAGEPSPTYAHMWWPDTTSGWVKQRNAANSDWEKKFPIASARVDVASAATLDLDANAVTSDYLRITGTTTVTAAMLAAGQRRIAVAGGAFQLTNSASLIVQGGGDYTTTAGDLLLFFGESGGVVRVAIMKSDGTTISGVASPVQGSFKNLALSATGTNASVSVSYDALILANGSGSYITDTSASGTIDTSTTGAGGLDSGTLAGSTWYSVWRIAKADGTKSWLISASATAPTMPSGYTYKARIGWIRTDGTANKYPLGFGQYGRIVQYRAGSGNVAALPVIASGAVGTLTTAASLAYGTASVTSVVPTTASRINVNLTATNSSGNGGCVAPNANYGTLISSTPPPIACLNAASNSAQNESGWMVLESTSIAIATASNMLVSCIGWEDNI